MTDSVSTELACHVFRLSAETLDEPGILRRTFALMQWPPVFSEADACGADFVLWLKTGGRQDLADSRAWLAQKFPGQEELHRTLTQRVDALEPIVRRELSTCSTSHLKPQQIAAFRWKSGPVPLSRIEILRNASIMKRRHRRDRRRWAPNLVIELLLPVAYLAFNPAITDQQISDIARECVTGLPAGVLAAAAAHWYTDHEILDTMTSLIRGSEMIMSRRVFDLIRKGVASAMTAAETPFLVQEALWYPTETYKLARFFDDAHHPLLASIFVSYRHAVRLEAWDWSISYWNASVYHPSELDSFLARAVLATQENQESESMRLVRKYGTEWYRNLQAALKGPRPGQAGACVRIMTRAMLRFAREHDLFLPHPLTVYRGTHSRHNTHSATITRAPLGSWQEWQGPRSTSCDIHFVSYWLSRGARDQGNESAIYEIVLPIGFPILIMDGVSHFGNEKEILLPPRTQIRVIDERRYANLPHAIVRCEAKFVEHKRVHGDAIKDQRMCSAFLETADEPPHKMAKA